MRIVIRPPAALLAASAGCGAAPPASAAGSATVAARLSWLECKEACLPAKGEVAITLPVGAAAQPSADAALFAATARRVPVKADGWRLAADAADDGVLLQLRPA